MATDQREQTRKPWAQQDDTADKDKADQQRLKHINRAHSPRVRKLEIKFLQLILITFNPLLEFLRN